MSNNQEDVKTEIHDEETGRINYTDFLKDTEEIEAEIKREEELRRQKRKERMKILPKGRPESTDSAVEEKAPETEENRDEDFYAAEEALRKADEVKLRTIAVIGITAAVICIYLVISYGFYRNRFLPSTVINDVDCSGMTVDEVSDIMVDKVLNYHLNIVYNDITVDEIYGKDIDLEFGELDKVLEEICHNQKKISWLKGVFFDSDPIYTTKGLKYDTLTLSQFTDSSLVLGMTGTKQSENAKLEYVNDKYEIIPEIQGDMIDKSAFVSGVAAAVAGLDTEIDINKDNLFIKPKLKADNENLIKSCKEANKLIKDKVELNITDDVFEIPVDVRKDWFSVSEEGSLVFDSRSFSSYMDRLDKSYASNNEERQFETFYGDTVTVRGGDYGTGVDRTRLVKDMGEAVMSGKDSHVVANITTFRKDIGKSYIEIDLSNQMLWMYKEGELILSSPVVSGRDTESTRTSEGVYRLKSKTENAEVTENGQTHKVGYFMSVNGANGICDASWKNLFGGQVYKEEGSDGSVYVLEEASKTIYENCYENMPVVLYNHELMDGFYYENSYMNELMDLIENKPDIPEYGSEENTEEASEENTEEIQEENSADDNAESAEEITDVPDEEYIPPVPTDETAPEEQPPEEPVQEEAEPQAPPEEEAVAEVPAENNDQDAAADTDNGSSAEEQQ